MHHTEEAVSPLARVELEHSNKEKGGNFVVIYLWVGNEIAASVSLNTHGEFVSDQAAEAMTAAITSTVLHDWTL